MLFITAIAPAQGIMLFITAIAPAQGIMVFSSAISPAQGALSFRALIMLTCTHATYIVHASSYFAYTRIHVQQSTCPLVVISVRGIRADGLVHMQSVLQPLTWQS